MALVEGSVMMNGAKRPISVLVAQFPVTLDIKENLGLMRELFDQAQEGDLVILPEGALSGYAEDAAFLEAVDTRLLKRSLDELRDEMRQRQLHGIFGSCLYESGQWYNAGLYYGPRGEQVVYHKVNLATGERGHFAAGSRLPVFEINLQGERVRLGIQLCREIRYPEQWQLLARRGAELFVYLTNAVGDERQVPVWQSHLVSRAAENQRFVLAANNAQAAQKCPSMIVAPDGRVLWEVVSPALAFNRCTLDLAEISDWYLSQARDDLVAVRKGRYDTS